MGLQLLRDEPEPTSWGPWQQAPERSMLQLFVRSTLDKLNFWRRLWFEPHRFCHDFFRYSVFMLALFSGRNEFGFQVLHSFVYLVGSLSRHPQRLPIPSVVL
jgi:hypothetical protein